MPICNYQCCKCLRKVSKIVAVEDVRKIQVCTHCSYTLKRIHTPPSPMVTEVLDNGIMPRAVERLADAERLGHERAKQAEERALDVFPEKT